MKLRWQIALGISALVLIIGIAVFVFTRQSQSALEKYKAKLRAQGEVLEIEKSFSPATNKPNDLAIFVDAATSLQGSLSNIGGIMWMKVQEPGSVRRLSEQAKIITRRPKAEVLMEWEALSSGLAKHSEELVTIRDFLTNPPVRMKGDYLDFRNYPKSPYMLKRRAGQWLAASALHNVHAQDATATVADLRALYALVNMHSQDPTLMNAMIRIGLTALALGPTWEALYGITNWTEPDLKDLQTSIERVDLLEAFTTGMVGERNFGLKGFEAALKEDGSLSMQSSPNGAQSVADTLWRNTIGNDDTLFYLQSMQRFVEHVRLLRKSQSFNEQRAYLDEMTQMHQSRADSWKRFRYAMSMGAIHIGVKTIERVVSNEVVRRISVVAVALKRHELRYGKLPQNLSGLVPEFLSAVPIDCMDGQPLRYTLTPEGSFLLYSVGADGKDDGGNPTPEKNATASEIWSGRDAVWPRPEIQ